LLITDRGEPAHVLLTFEEWRRSSGGRRSLAHALADPGLLSWAEAGVRLIERRDPGQGVASGSG
jgi:hypothetical protein